MRSKLLAAITAAALVAAAVFFVLSRQGDDPAAPAPSDPPRAASPWDSAEAAIGTPDRLVIPAIDVDAPVRPVGTTPENAQEVPTALDETGWWRDGVVPGGPGNAVVVGHTASADDGVFDRLVDAEAGDEVVIEGEDGSLTFAVERREVVPVEDFADVAGDVYRAEGEPGLVLMTCGDWNGKEFETTVIVHAAPA